MESHVPGPPAWGSGRDGAGRAAGGAARRGGPGAVGLAAGSVAVGPELTLRVCGHRPDPQLERADSVIALNIRTQVTVPVSFESVIP